MDRKAMLGHKVRRLRQGEGLTQAEMAEQLGISASYLNLIERNQRPVTVPMLFRLGQAFEIDLREFAQDEEASLIAGLREAFRDPLFEASSVPDVDLRELAAASPAAAGGLLMLYHAYRELLQGQQTLATRLTDRGQAGAEGASFPVDEVREYLQSISNHVAELEAAADELWRDADFAPERLFQGLCDHMLATHGVGTRVLPVDVMEDTLRRFDHHRRRILLSEALPPSGRKFQLAVQVALLGHRDLLDRLVDKAELASAEAKRLARLALANYFAGAVMMPYERFLAAAQDLSYDVELLGNRFEASFEQVCHRLTTLQRQGSRGIPFFFMRVDIAGNVSKRLSGGGFHFARFGGTCPRWIVHEAFGAPGLIHTQLAAMPDDTTFFTVARTVETAGGGYLARQQPMAVAVGCDVKHAKQLVYATGLDLKSAPVTPIGVSCRVCERLDCAQRAHPPLNHRLRIDENIRRVTPFGFAKG
ncbi:MAG: short-chain fatty acyl-CoA regulator family protein [Alphaproteobacteria bacterium]